MGSVAWLFPGQGSQAVGMSRDLAERYPSAMRAFDEASDAISLDLKKLAWDGPASELDLTANTPFTSTATYSASCTGTANTTVRTCPNIDVGSGGSTGGTTTGKHSGR